MAQIDDPRGVVCLGVVIGVGGHEVFCSFFGWRGVVVHGGFNCCEQ